jgi:hypothetical protein
LAVQQTCQLNGFNHASHIQQIDRAAMIGGRLLQVDTGNS